MMGELAILIPGNLSQLTKFLPTEIDQMWFVTNDGMGSWLREEDTGRDGFPDLFKKKSSREAKLMASLRLWFASSLTRRKRPSDL